MTPKERRIKKLGKILVDFYKSKNDSTGELIDKIEELYASLQQAKPIRDGEIEEFVIGLIPNIFDDDGLPTIQRAINYIKNNIKIKKSLDSTAEILSATDEQIQELIASFSSIVGNEKQAYIKLNDITPLIKAIRNLLERE